MGRFGGNDNGTIAPVELTMPYWEERNTPENDPVLKMAKLWAEENVRRLTLNRGTTPLDLILHECNDKCHQYTKEGKSLGIEHFFSREQFSERDVRIVNATVRWLATNCGRGFLADFFQEAMHSRIQSDPELIKRMRLEIEEANDNIA